MFQFLLELVIKPWSELVIAMGIEGIYLYVKGDEIY